MKSLPTGTLVYPKFNDNPPPTSANYKRKSEGGDERWILIPIPGSPWVPNFNGQSNPEQDFLDIENMSTPRIQRNGEVHYPHQGREAPPDIHGYQRKNSNLASPDAWKFVPIFPPCAHRTTQLYQRGCGSTGVHLVCNLTKAICVYEAWNPCKDIA